ncbi:kinase-like domain-containing protein [Dactylonectria estremocensis]|uniref:non-specific serine/threonine protein kinase n=1 Tax=Dactylonectria estremocensis TaxID=1079267 RepID=A0A9P9EMB8_9HYPO|nr:kinase-like domain-containing protein [Dactylonectria estremocensis]
MSLIPYQPHEGREIVLRHHDAIVVRDSTSHRLEIRGLSECPTCHQPLTGRPSPSPDRPYDRSFGARHESYVDPDYFRMLRAVNSDTSPDDAPASPVRRFFTPVLEHTTNPGARASTPSPEIQDGTAEFVSSTPGVAPTTGSKIRRNAFSPGYFNTFFVEERVLGKGGKGVVLLVRHEIDGCALGQFACKRVPVGNDHAWLEKVLIEVELLAKLSHPNLVSYRHVWLEDVRLTRFGPSVACAFILQQYCNGGDLHQYLVGGAPREATKEELKAQMRRRSKGQLDPPADLFSGHRQLSFDEIYSLFKDITSGVAYLHAANYIHRDLKPSNCLLHREGGRLICLISDFGEVQPENAVRKSSGTTGTISYCAPEVLKMEAAGRYGNFTTKSDVFSLGMILFFMCFGRLPYRNANAVQEELEDVDELRAEITHWQGFQDERRQRPDLPSKLYQLLKKLLSLNPAERPSANEVLKAMRGESLSFDAREDHPPVPALSINGNRVQNLDSPANPSTPVPASRQRQRPNSPDNFQPLDPWPGSSPRDTSPSAGVRSMRQEQSHSIGTRHRTSHSMVISRSQDGARSSAIASDVHEQDGVVERESFSPPLLMAPPPGTLSSIMRSRLGSFVLRVITISGPYLPLLSYIVRLSLFLVKMASLTRSCWPFIVSSQVGIPLVAVAALDLGIPQLRSPLLVTRPGRRSLILSGAYAWGLGTSLLLLALHFVVLWMAAESKALCATRDHEGLVYW